MDQRRGVDHFDHGGHADQRGAGFGEKLAAKQHQHRAQALAAAGLQILADVGDGVDRGDGFEADFALDLIEVVADQIEDFERGEGLAELAECHGKL